MSVLTLPRIIRPRRDPATVRAAEVAALERQWQRASRPDERIEAHLRMMLRRCGVTGGRALVVHRDDKTPHLSVGPGFTCHTISLGGVGGLKERTFDVVVCLDGAPKSLTTDIERILVPGGLLYVSTPDGAARLEPVFDGLHTVASGDDPTGTAAADARAFHAAVKPESASG